MTRTRVGVTYQVSLEHLRRTQDLLRAQGRRYREGYVVWVGELTATGHVRDVWPVSATGDVAHAAVAFRDVLALGERVHAAGWFILAQIHSHPGSAFHSAIDDRHAISHQAGFISIVVPDFAAKTPGADWAYYEHIEQGRWRPIVGAEITRRFGVDGKETWWKKLWGGITARRSSSVR